MLKKINDHIWVVEQKQSFLGLEMGTRMTIVKLSHGGLLVHSPIKLSEKIEDEIMKLGKVKFIIAPNLFHHLYVNEFRSKYPQAQLFCAPGLEVKRQDIEFDIIIEPDKKYAWSSDIDHFLLEGTPKCNEIVFYDKISKTLIVTDLGIHICEDSPFTTKLVFKLMGMFNKFGWSKLEKLLFIRNSNKFKGSIDLILNCDFEKIILSHGQIIESSGHKVFKKAFKSNL